MKSIYISLVFMLSTFFTNAQHDHIHCDHQSCGLQGTGVDEFSYVPPPASYEPFAPRDVVISVEYNGFTPEAQAAFQYAVDIWASILTSEVPILIEANWEDIPGNTLGFAGAAYVFPDPPNAPQEDYFYVAALANKLAGEDLVPNEIDITTTFDSATNWYLGTDGNTPSGEYDFVTVVLHELCHGLGMSGSATTNDNAGEWFFSDIFTIYDFYVENGEEADITSFPDMSIALGNQLTGNDLYWDGTTAVANNGGLRPRIYAPEDWAQGSSYSHLNESTYPAGNINSLMTPFVGTAEAVHDPGPIQTGIMADIGWTVTDNTGDQCQATGIELDFSCQFNSNEILTPYVEVTAFFTGDCTVETVCVQASDETEPTCFSLSDFDILISSGESVLVPIDENTPYDVWFTVDGNQSDIDNILSGECSEVEGCTNPYATNYNPLANADDGSCVYDQTICDCAGTEHTIGVITWLGDTFADDGSFDWESQAVDFNCADWGYDCGDVPDAPSEDPFGVCSGNLPPNNGCGGVIINGCTNPDADNFNPAANNDDVTCVYGSCELYIDFEGFENGTFIAEASDQVTTWSGTEGSDEDSQAFAGNSANGNISMPIIQEIPAGGPDDIFIPLGYTSGQYDLSFDIFISEGFGAYYNIQENTIPGDGWEFDVTFGSNGSIQITKDGDPLFSGNYSPGTWISVDHAFDLEENVVRLSVGTIVEFPIDLDVGLGGINFFALAPEDQFGQYYIDNVSVCGNNEIPGCTDPESCNFDPLATEDDGSCEYISCAGCTDPEACNFDPNALIDDESCDFVSCAGCTDPMACNFDESATINDLSCEYESCAGCTDAEACNFDPDALIDDGSCEFESCAGCTDPMACNFDESATINDFSCEYESCAGCTDAEACNYDEEASLDDGSCDFSCYGCTDPLAENFSVDATIDDGSCEYDFVICDCDAEEFSPEVLFLLGDGEANTGDFGVNFNCEVWGYDCGDIEDAPDLDPNGVCNGNLPPLNGCGVGVEEELSENWSLYPNPSADVVFLENSKFFGVVVLKVRDLSGRLIESQESIPITPGERIEINSNGTMAPGAYFLTINFDEKSETMQFVIK